MIAIIDYGMGNIGSVANMLKKVGAKPVITSDIATIEKADKLILPGVGAFDSGMLRLDQLGLISVLNAKVLQARTPILGLCLGMQLFTKSSDEGVLAGLGWIDAETVMFHFAENDNDLKVPHMGWNSVQIKNTSPIWEEMYPDARFYFAHSYHVRCSNEKDVAATTRYGYEFAAAVMRQNIVGTQFHPEKSHKFGMKLLRNFVERF